ncbi:thioredoxin family protein [Mycoplasmatota bacterium zrk1]
MKLVELREEFSENILVFGYTTNCGTCKFAEKMLDIVMESVSNIKVVKINLSMSNEIVNHYEIKSSPVFILLKHGKIFDIFYAAHSVVNIYEKISALLSS